MLKVTMPGIMRRLLRLFVIIIALFLIAILWFWWNRPTPVDMAANVPADSLVYLEANSLTDVASAVSETETWQSVATQIGFSATKRPNDWLTYLIRTTGLGSTQAVIAARSQIAFVMLNLTAAGNGDALEFKSQAALVVDTHTSAARVKPVVENAIGTLTTRVYLHPNIERVTIEGSELTRWISPDGQRRIVMAVDGSVVVIGNEEQAVSACLAARHGQRPSLLHNTELDAMRARLKANEALAFGYVSAANAARLVAAGAPILLGRLPQSEQLQKLLAVGAANLLGNVGWSARSFKGGIEDRYLIDLKPEVAARLQATFLSSEQHDQGAWEFVPASVDSVTSYNIHDPSAAWDSFNAAISSHLDVLSAVVFTTAFRAVLAPYGIDEPDSFLKSIKPQVLTVRTDLRSERATVIARIGNAEALHQFVSRRFGGHPRLEKVGPDEIVISADESLAASFVDDYFLLGEPEDVRRCLTARATHAAITSVPSGEHRLRHYLEQPSTANVVTFAKESERARAFIATVAVFRGTRSQLPSAIDGVIAALPYAVTETTLGDNGFERRTRSAFGQFASLVSFLTPEPAGPAP
ncbi:MAG: hypothetical protein JWM21_167 [Acidobacteria bacterium]|nr:hypothetical protein [Acidobacteriota bacterium]